MVWSVFYQVTARADFRSLRWPHMTCGFNHRRASFCSWYHVMFICICCSLHSMTVIMWKLLWCIMQSPSQPLSSSSSANTSLSAAAAARGASSSVYDDIDTDLHTPPIYSSLSSSSSHHYNSSSSLSASSGQSSAGSNAKIKVNREQKMVRTAEFRLISALYSK